MWNYSSELGDSNIKAKEKSCVFRAFHPLQAEKLLPLADSPTQRGRTASALSTGAVVFNRRQEKVFG